MYFKPVADVVYAPVLPIARAVGKPADEATIFIMLVTSVLLSLILSHIKTPLYRKLYNTALGPVLTLYTYGLGITTVIPYNIVGYLCMALAPRKQNHLYVIVINGLWLTANNVTRML